MPTYQYACTACDHRFETVQTFTEDSLTECPECSGKLRKLYGSVGVVFKGSGFYRNDSRSESNGHASSSGSGQSSEKTKSEKGASGNGDSGSGSSGSSDSSGSSGSGSGSSSSTSSGSTASSSVTAKTGS